MRRALVQFRGAGMEPAPVATDFNRVSEGRMVQDLIPNAEALM
jgi:hypothetical protein